MSTAVIVLAVLGFLGGAFSHRMAMWHGKEAKYWGDRALESRLGILDDSEYQVLDWVQANRPTVRERLQGWKSPRERMREAGHEWIDHG